MAVGSAAINLFLVIGMCNLLIPLGEMRRIKRVSVFLVNAGWSLFSYCWIFIILKVSSPGIVEIWVNQRRYDDVKRSISVEN